MKFLKGSIFGLIAIVFASLSFVSPESLFLIVVVGALAFMFLSFFKDRYKVASVIALCIVGFMGWRQYQEERDARRSSEEYVVKYVVDCTRCDVIYSDEHGEAPMLTGKNHYEETVFPRGNDEMKVAAINSSGEKSLIKVMVYVDGKLYKTDSAFGGTVASVYFSPIDIYK